MVKKIAIIGAGTMGSGIALCAAQNGFDVILHDVNEAGLANAQKNIDSNLSFLVSKQKISAEDKASIYNKILFSSSQQDCIADLIIEAIVEKIEVKQSLFSALAQINADTTILASNTSSLSINAIQQNIPNPERVAGMHFFNPAHIMKLVEVVRGKLTNDATINTLLEVCKTMQKTAVVCNDAPGFIVNRVARPYYLEAMHLVEMGLATVEDVDRIMEASGFKMGPFKLMDLIGMDVNLAVSQSVYEALGREPKFKPNRLQEEKVAEGKLGKKTGEGFYKY